MQATYDFHGRTAVIIGGSGVLGGAIARGFGAAGARVAVLGNRHPAKAEAVAADIRAGGGEALALAADVLSRAALATVVEQVLQHWARVDILVNCAGGARPEATTGPGRAFHDLPEEAVRQVMDLNFLGTFFPCQLFGRLMIQQGQGVIINVSSLGAYRPLTRSVAYSAGKAAVTNFTQWLAVHLSQEYGPGIRVNALVPGFFLTEQNRFLLTDEKSGELTERGRRIMAHTPLARFGKAEDLVGPALWLASDAATFVHGSAIVVDGGIAAFGGV